MPRLPFAYGRHQPAAVEARLAYGSFVSLQHRLLFVETPKAGSTTLKWILAKLSGNPPKPCLAGDETDLAMCIHYREHHPLPALTDLEPRLAEEVLESPDYRRVCVVRNPYARLVSAWADKIRQVEPGFQEVCRQILDHAGRKDCDGSPTFSEFVSWVIETNDPDTCDVHWRPQDKVLLADLIDYNFIIRTETLRADLARLFSTIDVRRGFDWSEVLESSAFNVTPPVRWAQTYDADLAARVAEFYSSAFDHFGYGRESWRQLVARPDPELDTFEAAALQAIRSRNAVIDLQAGLHRQPVPLFFLKRLSALLN